jgi:preprotein translocase subunit SecA
MLIMLSQGSRLAFDARTHRKATRKVTRINYNFLAAQIIGNSGVQDITDQVLEHLEEALQKLLYIKGLIEWNRFVQNSVTLQMLEQRVKDKLIERFGAERFETLAPLALDTLSAENKQLVIETLGRYLQNELYRFILLRVISDQWVDYLTRVEALRVSIGLEAYAQRDPLVQYKTKATEMFIGLLGDIRLGVVSRVFASQIRRGPAIEQSQPGDESGSQPAEKTAPQAGENEEKKRKRHRH